MNNRLAVAVVAGVFSAAFALAGDIVLIRDGSNQVPIYTASNKQSADYKSAGVLASYLKKITAADFAVQAMPTNPAAPGIWIGGEPGDLAADDFRITAGENRLRLAGGSPAATLCAVYAFLEDEAGCRWWSRNEEDVPRQATILVHETNAVCRSPFAIHNVWNMEAQNRENDFYHKARTTSSVSFSGGHTLYPLLTPYATNHPDLYPMGKTGERKANNLHFCYRAPGIAQALADALAQVVEAHRGDVTNVIYFAGMGDWYGGMCECPACKAVYEEETWTDPDGRKKPGYMATLLRLMNETAALLDKKYPGIRIGTFAYMSLEAPPAKTVPAGNVEIRIPRIRHCAVHPAAECALNRSYLRNLERWCEVAPGRTTIWAYGASFKNFLYPFPCLYAIAEDLRLYAKLGVRGVEIQGNYVSTGGDLAVLKNAVWRKLMWNPGLDPRALVRDFCQGYYGPAAEGVEAYVEALEESVRPATNGSCADEFCDFKFLTPPVRARLAEARDKALAAAGEREPFRQRVKEATAGLEAWALWKPGLLEEREGNLIRADLNEYTLSRARELLKYLRGANDTEWGTGCAAQLKFLARNGGPLVTLAHGETVYKVAPVLNGRVRQILYRSQPLLSVPAVKEKGYPMLGGCFENTGTYMMEPIEAGSNGVSMEGEAGLGSWNSIPKKKSRKQVCLDETGSLWMTGSVVRLVKEAGSETNTAVMTTVYDLGGGLAGVKAERLTTNGVWEALAISTNEVESLPLNGIRLDFKARGCRVEERYPFPANKTGKVQANLEKRTLTLSVEGEPVLSPFKVETVYYVRQLSVFPLAD